MRQTSNNRVTKPTPFCYNSVTKDTNSPFFEVNGHHPTLFPDALWGQTRRTERTSPYYCPTLAVFGVRLPEPPVAPVSKTPTEESENERPRSSTREDLRMRPLFSGRNPALPTYSWAENLSRVCAGSVPNK